MKSSHVPHVSLSQNHATSTPGTAQAVSRLPLSLSRKRLPSPVLMPPIACFRRVHRGSLSLVFLVHTCRILCDFSSTLTTIAFDHSRLRRSEAWSCNPASKGPPSSFVQLRTVRTVSDLLSALVAEASSQAFFAGREHRKRIASFIRRRASASYPTAGSSLLNNLPRLFRTHDHGSARSAGKRGPLLATRIKTRS